MQDGIEGEGREGGNFLFALPCFFRSFTLFSPCLDSIKNEIGNAVLSSQSVYQDTMNGNRWGYIVGKRNNLLA